MKWHNRKSKIARETTRDTTLKTAQIGQCTSIKSIVVECNSRTPETFSIANARIIASKNPVRKYVAQSYAELRSITTAELFL